MTSPDDIPRLLPEHRDNPFIAELPPLMSEQEVIAALSEEPSFKIEERGYPDHLRCACIMRLNHHYFRPLRRHLDLESRLAQLLREGYDGRNISDGSYLMHLRDNHARVVQRDMQACANPAPSTASGLTMIGCSGMGKTETTVRILRLYPQVIRHAKPYSFQQVVWLKLECPHMGSPRQLCLDFFSSMDALLGTSYFRQFHRANLDVLSTQMGRVATQHGLGLLVIDEVQNLQGGIKQDRNQLLNFLLGLINKIGVPMLLVGTLAATPLLKDTLRIARRASGLGSVVWERLERNEGWDFFIDDLWRFQWTRQPTELTPEIKDCLYAETQGILDLVVKLFLLAQIFAIQLSAQKPEKHGREQLSTSLFRRVAKENFKLLEPMLTALKSGNREAIAIYDDIRPFHDHIQNIFFNPAPIGGRGEANQQQKPVAAIDSASALQQARQALSGLGVAPDVIELALTDACARVDSNDPVVLTAAVLTQMRTPQPATAKVEQPVLLKPSNRSRKVKPALHEEDVRSIVLRGKGEGKNAHQALSEAGLIAPVESLYRVS